MELKGFLLSNTSSLVGLPAKKGPPPEIAAQLSAHTPAMDYCAKTTNTMPPPPTTTPPSVAGCCLGSDSFFSSQLYSINHASSRVPIRSHGYYEDRGLPKHPSPLDYLQCLNCLKHVKLI